MSLKAIYYYKVKEGKEGKLNNVAKLEAALKNSCSSSQWLWFSDKRCSLLDSDDLLQPLQIALAMAKRKVGHQPLINDPAVMHWQADEVARVLFIFTALEITAQSKQGLQDKELLTLLYQQGDEYEKEAILKGLSLLDSKGDLAELAQDSCRTNIITLFTAISQHNPYPAKFFSEGLFNQMILKSLFTDINIETIIGLRQRVNESMSIMCFDYVRERISASRSIPASIWLTIDLSLLPQAVDLFKQYIGDDNNQHRFYIALSLSWQKHCKLLTDDIAQRKNIETEANILALLNMSHQ